MSFLLTWINYNDQYIRCDNLLNTEEPTLPHRFIISIFINIVIITYVIINNSISHFISMSYLQTV